MNEETIIVRLGDIAEFINGGAWNQSEYAADGIPVVRVTNLKDEGVDLTDCKFLPVEALAKYSKHILRHGDLIIATVGSHPSQPGSVVGRPCIAPLKIDGALLNQNAVLIRTSTEALDQGWLAYIGKSKPFRDYVISCARGSANQVRMAIGLLKKMPIALPCVDVQRRTASILGAYDELMELNRRRIALLEEMAQRLFEEWFVRLRFPGHEGHPMVETQGGPMPDGWQTCPIGDAFEIVGGGTPSKAEASYWTEGTINWYTPTDLTGAKTAFMDHSSMQITEDGLRRSSAQLFPAFSVMMTSRATVGVISINTTEGCTNQGFITCIPNDRIPLCFLRNWLRINTPVFIAHATGSTFKEITKGVFRRLPITVPSQGLVAAHEKRSRPFLDLILNLERAQRRLAASRDHLLPRLISDDLSVSAAVRELEAAA